MWKNLFDFYVLNYYSELFERAQQRSGIAAKKAIFLFFESEIIACAASVFWLDITAENLYIYCKKYVTFYKNV